MNETKDFSTAAIASISTGRLLCKFPELHEAAEWLMGHPIWTHHFGSEQLTEDMKKAVLRQFPNMPVEIQGISQENYLEKLSEIETRFGKTLTVEKGSGLTAMMPQDGSDHLKDRTIFVKV